MYLAELSSQDIRSEILGFNSVKIMADTAAIQQNGDATMKFSQKETPSTLHCKEDEKGHPKVTPESLIVKPTTTEQDDILQKKEEVIFTQPQEKQVVMAVVTDDSKGAAPVTTEAQRLDAAVASTADPSTLEKAKKTSMTPGTDW